MKTIEDWKLDINTEIDDFFQQDRRFEEIFRFRNKIRRELKSILPEQMNLMLTINKFEFQKLSQDVMYLDLFLEICKYLDKKHFEFIETNTTSKDRK